MGFQRNLASFVDQVLFVLLSPVWWVTVYQYAHLSLHLLLPIGAFMQMVFSGSLGNWLWVWLNLGKFATAANDSHPWTTLLTIFISFLSDKSEYMLFQWRMSWLKWLCDWLNVVTPTFILIFPGENRLVEFSIKFIRAQISNYYWCPSFVMWPTDYSQLFLPRLHVYPLFLSACLYDFRKRGSTIFCCNCCIHIIVKAGTLHQSGRNISHCCVIEWWSKMSVTVKCLKMFLSSQRLIRRNPHLAFYFNWNPIFVISTNLLMVR